VERGADEEEIVVTATGHEVITVFGRSVDVAGGALFTVNDTGHDTRE